MSATATFHLGDLLSFTTGALVSPDHMAGVSKVAEFLTDGPVWTHQLVRLAEPVKAEIEAQHPWITAVAAPEFDFPAEISGTAAQVLVESWLAAQSRQYGELHDLTRPDVFGVLHQRDPIEEACDLVGPERVLTFNVDPADELEGGGR